MKVYFKTLGCDKNFVDTEKVAGFLDSKKIFEVTGNLNKSDIVIINTCSFIDEAVEENINMILEFINYRDKKNLDFKIVVVGCLPELYKDELKKEIPEVDKWIKPGDYSIIDKILSEKKNDNKTIEKGFLGEGFPRKFLNDSHYKFLKISDGCNLSCSYCIIPKIRGDYKSRDLDNIKEELKFIKNNSEVKELIIVSQNTSFFGMDKNEYDIIDFLELMGQFDFYWKRLMYLDIRKINKRFLMAMKDNGILPYFDIPLQHVNNNVLSDMNRNYTKNMIMEKIELIYKFFSKPLLRTTFIVGFPTETDEKFKELYNFVDEGIFHRLGVFEYSHQPLSIAHKKFEDRVSSFKKTERFNKLNRLVENSIKKDISEYINSTMEVLADSNSEGRIWRDAPEIDSCVLFNKQNLNKGKIYKAKIKNIINLEMEGEVVDEIHS